MRKPRLMTPGPAMVPEDVLLELARPVIHHRSNEFKQVLTEVAAGLKEVFQTQNDVLILTASGTGAMEAAVRMPCRRTARHWSSMPGHFAARWINLCKAFSMKHVSLDTEWGQPVEPERVEEALRQNPDTRASSARSARPRPARAIRSKPSGESWRRPRRSLRSTAYRESVRWNAAPTSGESTCFAWALRRRS